jgi:hypothetical protein
MLFEPGVLMNSDASGKVNTPSLPFFLHPENLEFFVGRSNHPVVEGEKLWRKLASMTLLAFILLFAFEIAWNGGYVNPSGPPLLIAFFGSALVFVILSTYFRCRHRALLSKGRMLEGRVLATDFLRDKVLAPLASVSGELHIWVKYLFVSPFGPINLPQVRSDY